MQNKGMSNYSKASSMVTKSVPLFLKKEGVGSRVLCVAECLKLVRVGVHFALGSHYPVYRTNVLCYIQFVNIHVCVCTPVMLSAAKHLPADPSLRSG